MLTIETLINDLAAGCKPKDQFRMGLEVERFAFNRNTGEALPYDGAQGIRALLEHFAAADNWQKITENGHVIALKKDDTALTLEPGGQVEYSGPPLKTLDELQAHLDNFHHALQKSADSLGIAFLSCGFHPSWTRQDIHIMPKARYELMRRYMPKKGDLGLDMMLRTCGAQINMDYSSETDMVKKYRVMLALQPLVNGFMANARLKEGRDTGYESYRTHIWADTDPDRSGFPAFVFDKNMGFARYVEKALDVPMYFFRRRGAYIDVTGRSFRDFMAGRLPGHEGLYPELSDWHDHLTTIFWDVRLKHYLELRGPDSAPPALIYAMAAFWKGLLYNEAVLSEAAAFVNRWPLAVHTAIHRDHARNGLRTRLPGGEEILSDWAAPVLKMAEAGLSGRERTLLQPFYDRLEQLQTQPKNPIAYGN